jgi:hypothetical protein
MDEGKLSYVRDGRTYRHGFLGGGLVDAVRGNPAAEQAANTYYGRNRDGLLISLGGLVCTVASSVFLISRLEHNQNDANEQRNVAAPLLLMTGCLVASYGGLIYMASGQPYQYDAINIFNDGPACQPTLPPGVVVPHAAGASPASDVPPCPGAPAPRVAEIR